jgi:transposase InsO family protein
MADALVLRLVKEIRLQLPRAGVPKLRVLLKGPLQEHGIKMGRDALYELLRRHGYLLRYHIRRTITTDSNHPFRKYPNLIRDIKYLTRPGQLWVSDITYIRLRKGFGYLSIVTDAYSHKIIGYCLYPSLHSTGTINALAQAAKGRKQYNLIHHSDRGIQYCSHDYVQMLKHFGIAISMTENGDPYENPVAERVNGILKGDFLLDQTFNSFSEASKAVDSAIKRYNSIRPHASCDNLTPDKAHQLTGKLKKHWKPKQYSPEKRN